MKVTIKQNVASTYLFETITYILLAVTIAGVVVYLSYYNPVIYTFLVTEDYWGEYSTAVCWGIVGILLIMLSFKPGTRWQKRIWAIIGIIAIIIAAEEVSWGQRFFGLATPEALRQINFQQELNFHNLSVLRPIYTRQWEIAGVLVIGWLIFSIVVSILNVRLGGWSQKYGLPLIPVRLLPIVMLAPCFLIFNPTVDREIGEVVLGIVVALWAFDQFITYGLSKRPVRFVAMGAMMGILLLVAGISASLSHVQLSYGSGHSVSWKLNKMAENIYPMEGMYDQSLHLYEYIYAHPRYVKPETEINHGKVLINYSIVLLKNGKQNDASNILSQAVKIFEPKNPIDVQPSERSRLLGKVFTLQEQPDKANTAFKKAIDADLVKFNSVVGPNRKAKLLWSMAQTKEASGDIAGAMEDVTQAIEMTTSDNLRLYLEKWILNLSVDIKKDGVHDRR